MQIEVMYLNPVREKPRCHEVGRGGYKTSSEKNLEIGEKVA